MEAQKNSLQKIGLTIALLAGSFVPALGSVPTPHIYNRGVHGHLNLTDTEQVLAVCPGLQFSQIYHGNGQSQDEHLMKNHIVSGGHYGRMDLARFQRCVSQNR